MYIFYWGYLEMIKQAAILNNGIIYKGKRHKDIYIDNRHLTKKGSEEGKKGRYEDKISPMLNALMSHPNCRQIGNQYRIQVDQEDFYIDLLLYHRKIKSLVAIELKTGKFKPETQITFTFGKVVRHLNSLV